MKKKIKYQIIYVLNYILKKYYCKRSLTYNRGSAHQFAILIIYHKRYWDYVIILEDMTVSYNARKW